MSDPDGEPIIVAADAQVTSFDGTALTCRFWEPPGGGPAHAPIALLHHGVAFYGAAYTGLGSFLAARGVPLCAPDARGHGRSGGNRGDMRNGRTMLLDLHTWVSWARHRWAHGASHRPLLLIGESMGGLFALNYAALFGDYPHCVAGLLLVAPGLLIHPRQVANFTVVRHVLQARRDPRAMGKALCAWRAALASSRDAAWMAAYAQDPLVLRKVNARYMLIVSTMSVRAPVAAARWPGPTLILHGKRDSVVPYQGSLMLYRLLGAADKELALFPDAWHTLFWDPDTPEVLARIEAWLAARFPIQHGG